MRDQEIHFAKEMQKVCVYVFLYAHLPFLLHLHVCPLCVLQLYAFR